MKTFSRIAAAVAVVVLLAHILLVRRALEGRHFAKYPAAAKLLISGSLPRERLADFSPLYLGMHAAAARFLPSPGAWILGIQVTAVLGSALLLLLLLERFFSPAAAAAGVLVFALCRSVAIHAALFEPEAMLLFLVLAASVLLTFRPRGAIPAAGLLVGLAMLLRPTVIPLAFVAPLFFFLEGKRGRGWLSHAALFLAAPLAALLLLSAVNARAGGGFSPAVMNPGGVFFEGNNPLSHGQSAVYPPLVYDLRTAFEEQPDRPHLSYRLVARRTEGRELSPPEVNAYWRGKALAFIGDYPGRFLRLEARKAHFFLHGFRLHDVVAAQWVEADLDRGGLPSLPFGLVTALSLAGMCVMAPRWRECWPAYSAVLIQASVVLAVYASERQRLAIIPFFIFFAFAALRHMARGRARWWLMSAVVPLVFLFQVENDLMRDERHRWETSRLSDGMVMLSRRLRDEGRFAEASRAAAAALAATPLSRDRLRPAYVPFPEGYAPAALVQAGLPPSGDAPGRLDRAILLLDAGRPAEADATLAALESEGRRFNRLYEGSSEPAFYRGLAALRMGDRVRATAAFGRALDRAPGDPFALAWLAALTGDAREAARITRYFGEADARFLLGRAHLDVGNGGEAVECFTYLAGILPEYRRGRMYLAASLAASGRSLEAAEAYRDAVTLGPEPVMLEAEILSAFREWSERSPGERVPAYRYGVALARYGRFREALRAQESAAGSGAPEVEEQIRWLRKALGASGGREEREGG